MTSLLVRGECDPSGSWVAWRWRFGGGMLLHAANCSPKLSVSSKGAPRLKIYQQVVEQFSGRDVVTNGVSYRNPAHGAAAAAVEIA